MMPFEKKSGAIVTLISKKLKNKGSYDDMRADSEEIRPKRTEDGAEVEISEHAVDAAMESILSAIKREDKQSLKTALKSFICMVMDED